MGSGQSIFESGREGASVEGARRGRGKRVVSEAPSSLPSAVEPAATGLREAGLDVEEERRLEAALLEAAAKGDRVSFRALYERTAPAAYRLARAVVGDAEVAEEVVQEAFCQAWARLRTFRGEARFRTWLLRIARNAALDLIRRERTRRSVDRNRIVERRRGAFAPDAPARLVELQAALEAALEELPERTSSAFRLAVLEGFSYEEVSRVVGTSLDAVKCRVYRAREHLRKRLEGFRTDRG